MRIKISLAVAAMVLAGFNTPLSAKTLKVQSSSTAGDWAHRYMTEKEGPKLSKLTNGEISIDVLPTKAIVPHRETIDAVANGILDGDLNAVAYFSGRDPAFAIMGDLIAGYDTPEQSRRFCSEGGGKEILQKLYDKYTKGKVHVIGCGPYSREALVSRVPVRSVAELSGVKIRSPEGLAAEVFKRAGATPVSLPFSEVYTSLEKGIVDAADASAYVNNEASGMHKVAKFPIFPGIHSMAVLQFIVNKGVWDKLTKDQQAKIEAWYTTAYDNMLKDAAEEDLRLVARDKAGSDITVVDWPQAERDKFRAIAVGAWDDFAKKSPLAREALDAHLAYMKKIGLLK